MKDYEHMTHRELDEEIDRNWAQMVRYAALAAFSFGVFVGITLGVLLG